MATIFRKGQQQIAAPTIRKPVRRCKNKQTPTIANNMITSYLKKVGPKDIEKVRTPKRKRIRRGSEEEENEEEDEKVSNIVQRKDRKDVRVGRFSHKPEIEIAPCTPMSQPVRSANIFEDVDGNVQR